MPSLRPQMESGKRLKEARSRFFPEWSRAMLGKNMKEQFISSVRPGAGRWRRAGTCSVLKKRSPVPGDRHNLSNAVFAEKRGGLERNTMKRIFAYLAVAMGCATALAATAETPPSAPASAAWLKAAAKGDLAAMRQLAGEGVRVDSADANGMTALHAAAKREVAAWLIEQGARVEAQTRAAWRPIHFAVARNASDVVALLLEKGADPSAPLPNGSTPLMLAAERGRLEVARLLLAREASLVKAQDGRGWTALHFAAMKNHAEMVELLVEKGADVNARSHGGGTPLHESAPSAPPAMMELLLRRGAEIEAVTKDGHTALMYAVEFKNEPVAAVLRQHGAKEKQPLPSEP